jgi:hypothetical protein
MEGYAGTAARGSRSSPLALRDRADHGESRGLVDPGVMNPEVRMSLTCTPLVGSLWAESAHKRSGQLSYGNEL